MNALITGATSGIGLCFAKLLASKGYNLIVVGRNENKLKELQKYLEQSYNVKVMSYQVDLSCEEEVRAFCSKVITLNIALKIVINNAGVGHYGAFMTQKSSCDREMIETNILALTALTKGLYPCYSKGTRVLQVASTAAFAPGPYMAVYYASKAYVVSLALALREEWKKEGIGVCVLCPGPTKTEFQNRAGMKKAEFANKLAMTAEEVVEIGYSGIIKNKAVIVPGITNQVAASAMQLLPKQIGAKLVNQTQKK